jgi:hypothetical protein
MLSGHFIDGLMIHLRYVFAMYRLHEHASAGKIHSFPSPNASLKMMSES